jgi:hypothetical protein
MSEGTVGYGLECSKIDEKWANVNDEGRSGRLPSVVRDDPVQRVDQKNCERRSFTI